MCGKGDDILISAFMVHFTFSDDKIGMNIGNCPVLHHFDKGTRTAIKTLADEDQLRAFAHMDARIFVTIMNHTFSGRSDPASEAPDTRADVGLRTYDLVSSFYGEVEIFDIGDDQFHRGSFFRMYLNSGVFTGVFQYSTGGGKSIVRFLYETNDCDRMRNQKHEDGGRNGYKRND